MTSCTGLYADVVYKKPEDFEDQDKLDAITSQYSEYKSSFAKNLKFDPNLANLSIHCPQSSISQQSTLSCNNQTSSFDSGSDLLCQRHLR